jgi:hypothetical protein
LKIIFILLAGALCLIAACSGGFVVNMKEQTNFPEGRELFVSKCNSCHQLYSPSLHTKTEWDSILVLMKKKAKINNEQRNEIYNWILEIKDNYEKSTAKNRINN